MSALTHKRGKSWDELPFESLEEVATFSRELEAIVNEALPDPPRIVTTSVTFDHGQTDWLSPDDFLAAVQEEDIGPIEAAETIFVTTNLDEAVLEKHPTAQGDFSAVLYIRTKYDGSFQTSFGVNGRKLTAVEGVLGATRRVIERYIASTKAEQERAERLRKQNADAGNPGRDPQRVIVEPGADEPKWKKILYDPWVIGIGAAVVAALIVALVLSA